MNFDYVVMPALILVVGALLVWLSLRRIISISTKNYRKWRKVTERIVLSLAALACAAVAASATFNAVSLLYFRAHNPPPGDTYLVAGHRMHMICTGSGSPTLVLDAGLGNDSLIWGGVQPWLSQTTRVCAYDRAGFGWSDALPPPRDADHVASELHQLLLQANINGPIVLMGHSIAGIYIRDYATRYPVDVAGLVFVDSSTPLQNQHPAFRAFLAKRPPVPLMRLEASAGIPRLKGECSQKFPGFDAHTAKLLAEENCHEQFGAELGELDSFTRSGEETVHTGPYGALPTLIFSQDPLKTLSEPNPKYLVDLANAWNQMQGDLLKLSTHSRRIIAKGSTHYVQLDRADLIKKEIPLFIEQIRGTAPQPTNFGSTVIE